MWAWPTAVHVRPRVRWQARRPPLGPSGPPCAGLCQSPSAAQARRLQSPARAPPGAAAGIRCPGTSETVGWVPKAGLTDTTPVQPHLALLAHRVLTMGEQELSAGAHTTDFKTFKADQPKPCFSKLVCDITRIIVMPMLLAPTSPNAE